MILETAKLGSTVTAALINSAFAEVDHIVVTPGQTVEVDDGPVIIGSNQHLEIPHGATLSRTAAGDPLNPLVQMRGQAPALTGLGRVVSAAPTPRGVVRMGSGDWVDTFVVSVTSGSSVVTSATAVFSAGDVGAVVSFRPAGGSYQNTTIASFQSSTQVTLSVAAAATDPAVPLYVQRGAGGSCVFGAIRDLQIVSRDIVASGDRGVVMQSAPQGGDFGTFSNNVESARIEGVDDALMFDAQANLNEASGVRFHKVNANVVFGRNSDEFLVRGGTVHASHDSTMVRLENSIFAAVDWLAAEPGGTASAYNIDAKCIDCVVTGMFNTAGSNVDLGSRTLIANRSILRFGGPIGLFGAAPVSRQTGVGVDAASIHAALVNLGAIAA